MKATLAKNSLGTSRLWLEADWSEGLLSLCTFAPVSQGLAVYMNISPWSMGVLSYYLISSCLTQYIAHQTVLSSPRSKSHRRASPSPHLQLMYRSLSSHPSFSFRRPRLAHSPLENFISLILATWAITTTRNRFGSENQTTPCHGCQLRPFLRMTKGNFLLRRA